MLCTCGKPATIEVTEEDGRKYWLCVDCNLKMEMAESLEIQRDTQLLNFALDAMAITAGIPRAALPPRMPTFQPPPMSLANVSNVNVDRSVVGVINTGTIQSLNNSVIALRQGGQAEAAKAILEFTQAVIDSNEATPAVKQQVAEIMDLIASEAAKPVAERRPAAIRPLVAEISQLVGGVAALSQLWETYGPWLLAFFN